MNSILIVTTAIGLVGLVVAACLIRREHRDANVRIDASERARTQVWLEDLRRANDSDGWDL